MLTWLWDWLSWRKHVIVLHRDKCRMRVVFWYRPWDKFNAYQERLNLEKDGWYKPINYWY